MILLIVWVEDSASWGSRFLDKNNFGRYLLDHSTYPTTTHKKKKNRIMQSPAAETVHL